MNLPRRVRLIEKRLALEVTVHYGTDGAPMYFSAVDPDLANRRFTRRAGTPSQVIGNLDRFAEDIYHERGKQQYRNQRGVCAWCEHPLNGIGETDHIKSRSKGRDDTLSNLRVLCSPCHRERHGGKA